MRTQSNIQDVAPCEQSYRLQVVGCYSDYAPVLSNVQCNLKVKVTLNPIQDVHFWAAHGWGGGAKRSPSLKYLTHILQWWNLAQLHLTIEDPKKIWITWHTPWLLLTSVFFSPEISKFCYIKKYRYRLHFSTKFLIILDFLESLKISLINLVISLMMSTKIATQVFLKWRYFQIKVMTS